MTGRSPRGLAAQRLPEFLLSQEPDGTWKAIPRYEITAELRAVGCLGVIRTATLDELEQACIAERIKRSRAAAQARQYGPDHLGEVVALTPYLAEQMDDLDALRDEGGDVPHNADG